MNGCIRNLYWCRLRRWGRLGQHCRFGDRLMIDRPGRVMLGDRVILNDQVRISVSPDATLVLGDGVELGMHAWLRVIGSGVLRIGNHTKINAYNIITCNREIDIGSHVMTAAFCHILDANHGMERGLPMRQQPKILSKTRIGSDVWIGSHCVVLAGTVIDDGVVLGAQSLARGHLKGNGIYVGAPCRLLRERMECRATTWSGEV